MLCAYPLNLSTGAVVGCGQCVPCRINKKREWIGRMLLEGKHCGASSGFWTLTYDEDNIPPGGTLSPHDLRVFFNQFRRLAGSFRYFAVGEYGDQTFRPHYHLITFGMGLQWHETVQAAWHRGHVYPGEARSEAYSYVASYVSKKMTGRDDPRLGDRHPEFTRMSRFPPLGIQGLHHIERMMYTREGCHLMHERGLPTTFRLDGRVWPLWRWGREWLAKRLVVLPADRIEALYKKAGFELDYNRFKVLVDAEAGDWPEVKIRAALYQEEQRAKQTEADRQEAISKARKRAAKAWRQRRLKSAI